MHCASVTKQQAEGFPVVPKATKLSCIATKSHWQSRPHAQQQVRGVLRRTARRSMVPWKLGKSCKSCCHKVLMYPSASQVNKQSLLAKPKCINHGDMPATIASLGPSPLTQPMAKDFECTKIKNLSDPSKTDQAVPRSGAPQSCGGLSKASCSDTNFARTAKRNMRPQLMLKQAELWQHIPITRNPPCIRKLRALFFFLILTCWPGLASGQEFPTQHVVFASFWHTPKGKHHLFRF